MLPFGGWLMPIQYASIVAEHMQTRSSAGLFDLSHMGRVSVSGPDAIRLLQAAMTNDVARLPLEGVHYSLICNEQGGVVEDLLVYRLADGWQLVVNAVNRPRVLGLLEALRVQLGCEAAIEDQTFDVALIGLQGPSAEVALSRLVDRDVSSMRYYRCRDVTLLLPSHGAVAGRVSRTGYTGEDGFEVFVPASAAMPLWRALTLDERVKPAGLGARDTLRLEAGMALYGHELTEMVTPFEAGLERVVRLDKPEWFQGRDALARLAATPPLRRLVGLTLSPGAVPRQGCAVVDALSQVGEVASGTFSPSLRKPIATAYVRSDLEVDGTQLAVVVRGSPMPATVVSLPFVPHRTKREGAVRSTH
jgi:aminomethyltransferase